MIARSTQTTVLSVLAALLLGLALPQSAQARDHGRDHDDERSSYSQRHDRGHRHQRHYAPRYYAPRYYPDVVVYRAPPRVYYSAPTYYAPARSYYPDEYGTVGIHLDYNLRF